MGNKKKKVTTTVTTTVTEEIVNVPTNELTQIVCILDRSGSMADIISDSLGGFNTILKKQKELPDKATITVALFDDRYDLLYDNIDIKKAEELTNKIWIPRGTTALYDAIGKTINTIRAEHQRLGDEKPDKVLVVIVTDGVENASHEYRLDDIEKLIKNCENDDWNFMYLAANQDAFKVGQSFGISHNNTYTYKANSLGVQTMSFVMADAALSYRSMNSADADFKTKSKNLVKNDNVNVTGDAGDIQFTTNTSTTVPDVKPEDNK